MYFFVWHFLLGTFLYIFLLGIFIIMYLGENDFCSRLFEILYASWVWISSCSYDLKIFLILIEKIVYFFSSHFRSLQPQWFLSLLPANCLWFLEHSANGLFASLFWLYFQNYVLFCLDHTENLFSKWFNLLVTFCNWILNPVVYLV